MESGDEDEAFTMGEKDWQKMQRSLSKQGYRDGKNDGRGKGMQDSFTTAAALSLKYATKLGQLVGVLEMEIFLQQKSNPDKDASTLQQQRLNELITKIESQIETLKSNDKYESSSAAEKDFNHKWETIFTELLNECLIACEQQPDLLSKYFM